MDDKKCAHAACYCTSIPSSEFCGDNCQAGTMEAGKECACGHAACHAVRHQAESRKAAMEAKTVSGSPNKPRGEDPGHTLIDPKPGDEQPPHREGE